MVRKAMTAKAVPAIEIQHSDREYNAYLPNMQAHFLHVLKLDGNSVFRTDAPELFPIYLAHLPAEVRQWHNCHACRRFINTYGGLVTISDTGLTTPVLWDASEAPDEIVLGIGALESIVTKAKVTGVFYSSNAYWGEPVTGSWRHLAVAAPKSIVFDRLTQTAFQAEAEKAEDHKNVLFALEQFTLPTIETAITLLKTDALYRSEKCLGVAEWLKSLHDIQHGARRGTQKARQNLIWREIARAPAGFCHPRSSMIGTLLDDIASGLSFEAVSSKFAAKMNPLSYQRPKAPPAAGNIAQAEKIVEQLGAAGSLARRFARLEEVKSIWRPKGSRVSGAGVFAHIQPSRPAPRAVNMPPVTMTWEKFQREVLPDAEQIEYCVRNDGHYCALVTATNPDAPPILQWDCVDQRNAVSWYVYPTGVTAANWGLHIGEYRRVTAVTMQPNTWNGGFEHQGNSAIFLLNGCRDANGPFSGLGLFPEILKSEFHGVRATIEAYSRRGSITGFAESTACGVRLQKGVQWADVFRVTSQGTQVQYKLDRWD